MQETEQWAPIPGWETLYSASNLGRIRSEDRTIATSNGQVRSYRGRILSQHVEPITGRRQVHLRRADFGKTYRVHRLVLEAFVGSCPEGMEACHYDDDSGNNRLDNLRWDTSLANKVDMARNGNGNQNHDKTHCIRGHEYTPENTYIRADGRTRDCRACWDVRPSRYQVQGTSNKEKTHCSNGHEFTPENTYTYQKPTHVQRTCRTCALDRARKRQGEVRSSTPCSINGCTNLVMANRLCSKHYTQQRRHGTTK